MAFLCASLCFGGCVPANLQSFHILFNRMRRNALGNTFLDGIEGNDFGKMYECTKRNNVGKKRLANFLDGKFGDRYADRMCKGWRLRYKICIEYERAGGIQIFVVFIRCLLRHGENEIRLFDMRMINRRVVDDDLGF